LSRALASCQSTQLSLKVRTPGAADASARVRIVRTEGSPCTAGLLFAGSMDTSGNLAVHTPACGPMRLIVSRRGSRTVQREVDSCDVRGLEVVLWPALPAREPADACAQTARRFLQAWVHLDEPAARAQWAGPKDFASVALDDSHVAPGTVDVAAGAIDGAKCRVESRHFYENGCEETWRVELERLPEGWRVRALDRTDAPSTSSLARSRRRNDSRSSARCSARPSGRRATGGLHGTFGHLGN
jgi:hypothetical protein